MKTMPLMKNENDEMAAGEITGRGGTTRGEGRRRRWPGGEGIREEEGRTGGEEKKRWRERMGESSSSSLKTVTRYHLIRIS